jgi:Flp pilus assembly protein TadG
LQNEALMRKTLFGILRDRGDAHESGTAAVEFAIVAPLLVALVIGVADYGSLMNSTAALVAGTRSGAEVAKANPSVSADDLTALNIFPSGATPSQPTFSCTCIDNTSATCPGINDPNPCAAKTPSRVLKYITVSASQTFAPWLPVQNLQYMGSFGSRSLSSSATARLQ